MIDSYFLLFKIFSNGLNELAIAHLHIGNEQAALYIG